MKIRSFTSPGLTVCSLSGPELYSQADFAVGFPGKTAELVYSDYRIITLHLGEELLVELVAKALLQGFELRRAPAGR